jgi:hypothetical protein
MSVDVDMVLGDLPVPRRDGAAFHAKGPTLVHLPKNSAAKLHIVRELSAQRPDAVTIFRDDHVAFHRGENTGLHRRRLERGIRHVVQRRLFATLLHDRPGKRIRQHPQKTLSLLVVMLAVFPSLCLSAGVGNVAAYPLRLLAVFFRRQRMPVQRDQPSHFPLRSLNLVEGFCLPRCIAFIFVAPQALVGLARLQLRKHRPTHDFIRRSGSRRRRRG